MSISDRESKFSRISGQYIIEKTECIIYMNSKGKIEQIHSNCEKMYYKGLTPQMCSIWSLVSPKKPKLRSYISSLWSKDTTFEKS